MKFRVLMMTVCLFLFAAAASPMWAEPLDPIVKLTVKQPVALPGHVLEPGKYYLTNLDFGNVVQVRSANGTQAFFELAGSASRRQPTGRAVVNVSQQETGGVPRIMDYFYPGDTNGTAFYYPLHGSAKLAKQPALRSRAS